MIAAALEILACPYGARLRGAELSCLANARQVMEKQVFISYSTEDSATAFQVCAFLEKQGFECWIAPRDVRPGFDYREEIIRAIEGTHSFVLLLSEGSNESQWVPREVERGLSKRKQIFPVRIRNVAPNEKLELCLAGLHYLDAWAPPLEPKIAQLASAIRQAQEADSKERRIGSPSRGRGGTQRPSGLTPAASSSAPSQRHGVALGVGACLVITALALLTLPRSSARGPAPGSGAPDASPGSSAPAGPVAADVPPGMVVIPGGEFISGVSGQTIDDLAGRFRLGASFMDDFRSRPLARTQVATFLVDIHEVSNADYLKFVKGTGYPPPRDWDHGEFPFSPDRADHPVANVSYSDAVSFATWAGKRLPTALEWEKAMRGTDGRLYPWGNTYDRERCNGADSGRRSTVPVSSMPEGKSPYGLFHGAGNVGEWTSSKNPQGYRVLCGGDWTATGTLYGLCFMHNNAATDSLTRPDYGFRCAR